MFTHIRTSKENREVVAQLTRKLNLGTENIIARIALTYSLSKDCKLDLGKLKDSGGKEYSKSVLFGDYLDYYLGMVAMHYGLHITDKDLSKYVKLHIDHGLTLINADFESASNLDSFDYIIGKIASGITLIKN